jgi:hypothetical protein
MLVLATQDQSSKSVVCLPTREGARQLLLHFGSRDGGNPKGREQRQGEAGGGGTEQVHIEVGVANSEQRRGGNSLVWLELRGVAAGVPVAVWQLTSEGVHARECARAHGWPVSSNDQTVAAQRSGGRQRWRTTWRGHHLANGGARSGTACPAVVWLAPACVCRRETLDAELQTGQKRRQLDLARTRQRIAQLKVEPWSVSGRSSHDGETPERWCCVQVAGVLAPAHKRAKRCTGVAKSP